MSLVLLFTSCEELAIDPESIFEQSASEQIPDITNIVSNVDGSTVSCNWNGNEFALGYSYMLYPNSLSGVTDPGQMVSQPYFDWSDWTIETGMYFYNLDEGNYTLSVKSRFDLGQEEVGPFKSTSFDINNILGPSLRIYPLNQTAQSGDEIDVYLYFEDVEQVSAVTGLHLDINIPSELEFITDSYDQGDLIKQFSGTTIYPTPSYSDGTISIDGVADNNGSGLYGTGSIAKFRLRVMTTGGTFNISIANGSYKDINDNAIGFQDPVGGSVTVIGAGQ